MYVVWSSFSVTNLHTKHIVFDRLYTHSGIHNVDVCRITILVQLSLLSFVGV